MLCIKYVGLRGQPRPRRRLDRGSPLRRGERRRRIKHINLTYMNKTYNDITQHINNIQQSAYVHYIYNEI